nr:hypothetical protein [Clostridia bacterium]
MIISISEKYDVSPEWFEEQVKTALMIAEPSIVEKLTLPRLCELLAVYRCQDEVGAREAAEKMKVLVDCRIIDEALD